MITSSSDHAGASPRPLNFPVMVPQSSTLEPQSRWSALEQSSVAKSTVCSCGRRERAEWTGLPARLLGHEAAVTWGWPASVSLVARKR